MRDQGIALVSALVAMVAVLMMALGMSYLAEAHLTTGRHLVQQATARQRAEAGIDHALVYLRENPWLEEVITLAGEGYSSRITPQGSGQGSYRVESTGTFGQARHVAVAIVQMENPSAATQNPGLNALHSDLPQTEGNSEPRPRVSFRR
ncbi:MAG: hypothetical protein ACK4ZX_08090 [Thermus sp.]